MTSPTDTSLAPASEDVMQPFRAFEAFTTTHSLPHGDPLTAVTYQVHEDLRLIRRWTGLRVVRGKLQRPYLAGSAAPNFDSVFPAAADGVDRTQAVLPMSTAERLTPRVLKELCAGVVHPDTGARLRCVTVAIVDDDSTTAYYRVFDAWEEIVHPQWKMKKEEDKRSRRGTKGRAGKREEDEALSDDMDASASGSSGTESE